MVALVVVSALLVLPIAVIEGGKQAAYRLHQWHNDRKLFRRLRRTYT